MFKRRSFQTTVKLLCASRREFYRRNGTLNVTRAASEMKMNQETLKRILDGDSKSPAKQTSDKMCRYFKISLDQLVGNRPIPWIDQVGSEGSRSKNIEEIIELCSTYGPDFEKELVEFARFRSAGRDPDE